MTPLLITRHVTPFQSDTSVIDDKALSLLVSEYLLNSTNQVMGIANAWSIQILVRPNSADLNMYLMQLLSSADSQNKINILQRGTIGGDPLRIVLDDSSGVNFKDYQWNNTYSTQVKVNYLITWDGTNLLLYVDGVETAPDTLTVDNAGTMSDSTRAVSVGARTNGTSQLVARIHSVAMWSAVLGQDAATYLENSGIPENLDHRVNKGNYSFSGDLVHYWRLGLDAGDIGKDSGTANIDIGDNAVGIGADDIVNY